MPREELALYLTLTPEFGGKRFGPFEGLEVRLGTDHERCHIVLADNLGVARDHCKVLRQGPDSLILTPSERTAGVWLWKAQAIRPTQVQSPTAVRPGDAFSLVTQDGPRFVILLAPLPDDVKAARSTTGKRSRRNLTPAKLLMEIWRIFLARLYTFSPVSAGARLWYFITSGAIWQPRILITLFLSGMTFLTMLFGSCRMMSLQNQISGLTAEKTEMESNLKVCGDMGKKVENYNFNDLVYLLTGSPNLKRALDKDGVLKGKVKEQAQLIASSRDRYDWLYKNPSVISAYKAWRERIVENDQTKAAIDPYTRVLLAFAAATPNRIDSKWTNGVDSQSEDACLRGPLPMTYRQALQLGLLAQPDAYVRGDATTFSTTPGARLDLLRGATQKAHQLELADTTESDLYAISQGDRTCVHALGDDDRDDTGKVARMLMDQFGLSASGLPSKDFDNAEVSRVAKFFAADIPGVSFAENVKPAISFTKGTPTAALKDFPGGDWVIDRTAETIARSIVLPCDALLNGNPDEMEKVFGKLPDAVPCLVLFYRLQHED
jgi:hypothetical protein